ncbi:hypothetical protein MY5147_009885 [Beauveria neobassiana]
MWSLRSTSSILTVLCQLCSVSSLPSTKLATPQSGDALAHLQGSTSPKVTYTTKVSHLQNGIGFSKREDSPAAASGASYHQCAGKCRDGWHLVEGQCVQDLCASSSPGVAWHYYQLTQGTGPGQIPYTPQPAPQPFDLSRIMSGPSIPAPINGTADKAGWVDQGNLRQGTTGPSSLRVVRLSPNIPSSASYFLMFWTGFLVPRTTGPYTFYTWWVDDSAYLWVGDKALSPTATNFDMHIRYASQDSYGVKRYTVNAVAGKPIPYTLLNVQSGGPFSLCFAIKENDRVIMNSCREAGEWPVATSEVVSCPNARFRPVFTA